MKWQRVVGAGLLVVAVAGCGGNGDGDDGEAVEPVAGTDPPVEEVTGCPGEELGRAPLEFEAELRDGVEYLDPEVTGVAVTPDGIVYVLSEDAVYCVDGDDLVHEVAPPDIYPEGEEESTWSGIAVNPDGDPVLVDWQNPRAFTLADGELTLVPGSDTPEIGGSRSIAVGPDGTVFVTGLDQSGSAGVWAIRDGEAEIYAGEGRRGSSGDGGPAVDAHLDEPEGIAVDADGVLYVADRNNNRVASVDTDGILHHLAGGEDFDDIPPSDAIRSPQDVAITPDGEVLVLGSAGPDEESGVFRIVGDGEVETVLGGEGTCEPSIDDDEGETCPVDDYGMSFGYRIAAGPGDTLWIVDDGMLLRVADGTVAPVLALTAA